MVVCEATVAYLDHELLRADYLVQPQVPRVQGLALESGQWMLVDSNGTELPAYILSH